MNNPPRNHVPDKDTRTHAAAAARPRAAARAANTALAWVVTFTAVHLYWYLGGRVGFGDQSDPLPPAPSTVRDWIASIILWGMFAVGLAVPVAFTRPWGKPIPRRLIVWLMWVGALILLARGGAGLLDDLLRFTGLDDRGLTGLSTADVAASAHPTTYTKVSTIALDTVFLLGGLLFTRTAHLARTARTATAKPQVPEPRYGDAARVTDRPA